jgi:hypothetical protein
MQLLNNNLKGRAKESPIIENHHHRRISTVSPSFTASRSPFETELVRVQNFFKLNEHPG